MVLPKVDVEYHGVEIQGRIPEHIVEWLESKCKGKYFIKNSLTGPIIYFLEERDHFRFLLTWGK